MWVCMFLFSMYTSGIVVFSQLMCDGNSALSIVHYLIVAVKSDIHNLLWSHNQEGSCFLAGVCVCAQWSVRRSGVCLAHFLSWVRHCYSGVFLCAHSGMCVSGLVCTEWLVMQVEWGAGRTKFEPLGVSVLQHTTKTWFYWVSNVFTYPGEATHCFKVYNKM